MIHLNVPSPNDTSNLSVSLLKHDSIAPAKYDIVHIKRTPYKKGFINYYWNNKTKEIIQGKGGLLCRKSVYSIARFVKYNETTSNLARKEMQIGDSVGILFNTTVALFLFGVIVGADVRDGDIYYHILPSSKEFPYKNEGGGIIKVKYEKNKFYLLSDGKNERYENMAIPNLVFAKYQYQVDFAEIVSSYLTSYKLIKFYAEDMTKVLNENTFLSCHKSLFGKCYLWAGKYRTHPVVVGNRERPTMESADIRAALKKCFRRCNRTELNKIKNKTDLVNKLAFLHAELAWIHPFQDGNGRTIRLFLQIVSATKGYEFDLTELEGSVHKKRAYHYAVRRAIYDKKSNLIALITRAVKEL
ncbi:Fic family protein [Pectobacterium brasiliense]|uniref:Fic family protein n=1 Tax=Pectobacterium brasiliense TaxID=180957 RepID=UPI00068DAAB6|nr:Fic family protein [Pectobacterium brasiliense]